VFRTQVPDLISFDGRVQAAIADLPDNPSAEELALVIECAQRMIEYYDELLDNPPSIIPALSDEGVDFIADKLQELTT